jgi:hypothetical protein
VHAQRRQFLQHRQSIFGGKHRLGDLDFQPPRRNAGALERVAHELWKASPAQLNCRHMSASRGGAMLSR